MLVEDDGGSAVDYVVDLPLEAPAHRPADAAMRQQQVALHAQEQRYHPVTV